jgi:hypothetical protein
MLVDETSGVMFHKIFALGQRPLVGLSQEFVGFGKCIAVMVGLVTWLTDGKKERRIALQPTVAQHRGAKLRFPLVPGNREVQQQWVWPQLLNTRRLLGQIMTESRWSTPFTFHYGVCASTPQIASTP